MNQYTIYWPNGYKEVIRGNSLADALYRQQYGQSAILGIYKSVEGVDNNYIWNFTTHQWEKIAFIEG